MTNPCRAGIEVICYHFMPVLEETRTDLAWRLTNGAPCMRFDFAVFDIHIIDGAGAVEEFGQLVAEAAAARFAAMEDMDRKALTANVVFGVRGAASWMTLVNVQAHLAEYDAISAGRLRHHLIDFLAEVMPLAQDLGMQLCCHAYDAPFPRLGLPRIMSTEANYRAVILAEERRRRAVGRADWNILFRPDHGQNILDDLGRKGQPGDPTIGRLKGLAVLRSNIAALEHLLVTRAHR